VCSRRLERKLFSKRALGRTTSPDLADRVERLLLERALEDLGRARRAGRAVAGFVRVEQMIGRKMAGLVDRGERGRWRRAFKAPEHRPPLERLGDAAGLGGVFGREQAVYVAVAHDDKSGQFIQRIAGGAARWRHFGLKSAGDGPERTKDNTRYVGRTERNNKPSKPLTLSTTARGAAAGKADATQVKQKFSHGRTRAVTVEVKKPVKRPRAPPLSQPPLPPRRRRSRPLQRRQPPAP